MSEQYIDSIMHGATIKVLYTYSYVQTTMTNVNENTLQRYNTQYTTIIR